MWGRADIFGKQKRLINQTMRCFFSCILLSSAPPRNPVTAAPKRRCAIVFRTVTNDEKEPVPKAKIIPLEKVGVGGEVVVRQSPENDEEERKEDQAAKEEEDGMEEKDGRSGRGV